MPSHHAYLGETAKPANASKKSHICKECGKQFNHAGNLRKHLLTHTGEKPYSCGFCKREFAQSGNLKRHIASHHSDISETS